jgi:hypothetical protein
MSFSRGSIFALDFALALLGAGISVADVSAMLTSIESKGIIIVENDKHAVLTEQKCKEHYAIKIDPYTGGLDFHPVLLGMPGMCPKEYGLSIYHGNKRKRSNRLRFSHNAKLKRR